MATGPVSRRSLIGAAALGAFGAGALRFSAATGLDLTRPLLFTSPQVQPFRDRLPILPTRDGSSATVVARTTQHQFHRDWGSSPAFAYGDETYLGPVLENTAGVTSRVTLQNQLGAHPFAKDIDHTLHGVPADFATAPRTVLHMHGGKTPPEHDGHPHDFLASGEQHTHEFPNRQAATAMWYHDHSMGTTRLNVYAGLASMYLLRDEWDTGRPDNPLALPAGEFEVPLMLQEKIFKPGGVQSVRSTVIVPEGSWEGGAVGDVGVVNGKVWPEMDVARGLYRFRIINAGSYSVWNLFFSNAMPFWVIGTDGGLLDAPVQTTSLRLAPAERLDVLVDFGRLASGETVELRNDEAPPGQAAIIGARLMPLFCRFRAGATTGHTGPIPQTLRGGPGQPPKLPPLPTPTRVRNVTLSQPFDLRIPPSVMSLNNLPFTTDDIEMPLQGTTEQWNIVNVTPDPHPVHIHLIMFRILNRQKLNWFSYQLVNPQPPVGTRWTPSPQGYEIGPTHAPAPWESGLKDTVRVDGHSITRIVMRWPTEDELGFDPDASFQPHGATARASDPSHGEHLEKIQGYVWHCHILDHEDHDMMLRFRTPAPNPAS